MTDKKEEKVIEPEIVDAEVSKEAKQMAMLAHILAIPGGFVGPLIIFLLKKDESEFIEFHSREALNFQITLLLASFVGVGFTFFCLLGVVFIPAIVIVDIVFCILAGIKANDGEKYEYPVSIRIVKPSELKK